MKKLISNSCMPAMLFCLLCFAILGCDFFRWKDSDFPRTDTYTITLQNNSDQEIHMFLEGGWFDPSNKVEGGKQIIATFQQGWATINDKDSEFTVEAGREGIILDEKTISISATGSRKYTVKWDGYGLY